MRKPQRLNRIVELLREEGALPVNSLSERLGVSHMTIRRDLETLASNQIVKLIYGGAALSPAAHSDPAEKPYSLHNASARRIEDKKRIGGFASTLIEPNETLIIDSGSTTEFIAKQIPADLSLTVICYALNIFAAVQRHGCERIILGGGVYHENLMMFESPESVALIRRYRARRAFVSAAGVSPEFGVTCRNAFERETKRAVIESSVEKILLVDSSKFGTVYSDYFGDLDEFDTIVTDTSISVSALTELRACDITVWTV